MFCNRFFLKALYCRVNLCQKTLCLCAFVAIILVVAMLLQVDSRKQKMFCCKSLTG